MSEEYCIIDASNLTSLNGATDRTSAFANLLSKSGYNVKVYTPGPISETPHSEILEDVEIVPVGDNVHLKSKGSLLRAFVLAVLQKIPENSILQIEHAALGGIASLLSNREFILDVHEFQSLLSKFRLKQESIRFGRVENRVLGYLEKRGIEACSEVIFTTNNAVSIIEKLDVGYENKSIVPNGYFPHIIQNRQTQQFANGRVVFLGSLKPRLDIECLAEISNLEAVSELSIIGGGDDEVVEKVRELSGQSDSVRYYGKQPYNEVVNVLSNSSVGINPFRSIVSDEYMKTASPVKLNYYAAVGLPIVATPGTEIFKNLENSGAARSADNSREHVEQIKEILEEEEIYQMMREASLECGSEMTWEHRLRPFISSLE